MARMLTILALCLTLSGALVLRDPTPAEAVNLLKPICTVAGAINKLARGACLAAQFGGRVVSAGKKLASGHVGSAVGALLGQGGGSAAASVAGKAAFLVGLAALGSWVLGGARTALSLTARLLDHTTRPQLSSTWFSSLYWRIAGIAALLTLPFLFAAAIQALLRSDMSLLARSALGYLPLSLLVVSIAAPVTMLLLSATDGMSAAVSAASERASSHFLGQLGVVSVGLSVLSKSPFVSFFIGLLVVAAAVLLWVEMLMRDAAIYVVVLMLPLVFTALVWPARRGWAIRTVEVLVALILSKFVIVSVLSLGGAALGHTLSGGVGALLVGLVLVTLAAASPWALMRLLPMTELAGAAAGHLRSELGIVSRGAAAADGSMGAQEWLSDLPARMGRQGQDAAAAQNGAAAGERSKLGSRDGARRATQAMAAEEAVDGLGPDGRLDGDAEAGLDAAEAGVSGLGAPDGMPAEASERIPGLDDIYQAPDETWDPLPLGPEAYEPGGALADPLDLDAGDGGPITPGDGQAPSAGAAGAGSGGGAGGSGGGAGSSGGGGGGSGADTPAARPVPTSGADEHDARPPRQEARDGGL